MTYHLDLTIRFHDVSAQLLVSSQSTPINHNYPNALPSLTMDLKSVLMDPFVSKRLSPMSIDQARINSVHLSQESLEAIAILQGGELVVYRLHDSHGPPVSGQALDEELLVLKHVLTQPMSRFSPYFMFTPGIGLPEACALSDIGKLQV